MSAISPLHKEHGPVEPDMVAWKLTDMREDLWRLLGDLKVYAEHGEVGAQIIKGLWEKFLREKIEYFILASPRPGSLAAVALKHLYDIRVLISYDREPNLPTQLLQNVYRDLGLIPIRSDELEYTPRKEDFEEAAKSVLALIAIAPEEKIPPLALRK